jgi:hypothetical protein
MNIEWITPDELYWQQNNDGGRNGGILYKVNPIGGRHITMAYVKKVFLGGASGLQGYEALLVRLSKHTVDDWSLGIFETNQEAKDIVITALVLNRLEGTENLTKGP